MEFKTGDLLRAATITARVFMYLWPTVAAASHAIRGKSATMLVHIGTVKMMGGDALKYIFKKRPEAMVLSRTAVQNRVHIEGIHNLIEDSIRRHAVEQKLNIIKSIFKEYGRDN